MSVEALQTTLAAEHAAVWVYALLGAQTSRSDQPTLYADVDAAYRIHRGRRDQLLTVITDRGVGPVAAEVGYRVPDVDTPARVIAVARRTEQRCATTYADLWRGPRVPSVGGRSAR